MMPIRYFETAAPAFVHGDDGMVPEETMSGLWVTIASGQRHHRPDDAEDPVTTTKVIQMTDAGWAVGIARAMNGAKHGHKPGLSVEAAIMESLHEVYVPRRCWCEHDCCGHRSGFCDVTHVGGTIFMVQIHTSRNY